MAVLRICPPSPSYFVFWFPQLGQNPLSLPIAYFVQLINYLLWCRFMVVIMWTKRAWLTSYHLGSFRSHTLVMDGKFGLEPNLGRLCHWRVSFDQFIWAFLSTLLNTLSARNLFITGIPSSKNLCRNISELLDNTIGSFDMVTVYTPSLVTNPFPSLGTSPKHSSHPSHIVWVDLEQLYRWFLLANAPTGTDALLYFSEATVPYLNNWIRGHAASH